jgi:hypothetical protein
MQVTKLHGLESIDLSDTTDLDADADRDTLIDAVTSLANAVTRLAEENEDLRQRVTQLEADQDEAAEHRRDVEDTVEKHDDRLDHILGDVADHDARLTDVENAVEDEDADGQPHASTDRDHRAETGVAPETALEDVVSLPEHVAEDSLSANQYRARFVASDIVEYSTSVPAGRALAASDLSTVLRAGTDARGHSQTVDRVLRLLDDLGEDAVDVVEGRDGQRRVIVSEDGARRLSQLADSESHGGDSPRGVAV